MLRGSSDDSRPTLQRLKLCCKYIKLFYKLVDALSLPLSPPPHLPPPVCRWTDCSSSPRGDRPSSALLCCFNYPRLLHKRQLPDGVTSAHSSLPPALLCLFEPHKRKRGLTLPEAGREDPALRGRSAETSARRCSSEGDVLQCGASSPRGGDSVRHNLFIYHIQDVWVPLTSQNVEPRRQKARLRLETLGFFFFWLN